MTGEQLAYFGMCVATLGFAAGAPKGQRLAVSAVSVALLGNWLICQATYTYRLPFSAPDIWAIADLIVGVVALRVGWQYWWGWALWGLCIAQESIHAARFMIGDISYIYWLDKLLLAQVAVFVLVGGGGVANWMLDNVGIRWMGRTPRHRLAKVVRS